MRKDNNSLDVLVDVIEMLQKRIERDYTTISTNEIRTRNALVDPLLKALGWSDPSVVTQEYLLRYGTGPADYGVVDYALHRPSQRARLIALVEAKRMSTDLSSDHRDQIISYASIRRKYGIEWVGLTNGDHWEFYEISEGAHRLLIRVSIRRERARDCAVKLLQFHQDREGLTVTKPTHPVDVSPDRDKVLPNLSYEEPAHSVDVRRMLSWWGFFLILGSIVGYATGILSAQPVFGEFKVILVVFGMLVVVLVIVTTTLVILRHVPWKRLWGWLRAIEGDLNKTLIWSGGGAVVLGGLSGYGSYVAGLRTAKQIYDGLVVLGGVTLITIITFIVIAIFLNSRRGSG